MAASSWEGVFTNWHSGMWMICLGAVPNVPTHGQQVEVDLSSQPCSDMFTSAGAYCRGPYMATWVPSMFTNVGIQDRLSVILAMNRQADQDWARRFVEVRLKLGSQHNPQSEKAATSQPRAELSVTIHGTSLKAAWHALIFHLGKVPNLIPEPQGNLILKNKQIIICWPFWGQI